MRGWKNTAIEQLPPLFEKKFEHFSQKELISPKTPYILIIIKIRNHYPIDSAFYSEK
jgi:hypothetical protein